MVLAISRVLFAAVLAGYALAIPHKGPHPEYATTIVTTLDGTPTTIVATIDPPTAPWPPTSIPVATPSAVTATGTVDGHLTTYTYTVYPLPPGGGPTTFDTPIPTTVVTTSDGHVTTYTTTIYPFGM